MAITVCNGDKICNKLTVNSESVSPIVMPQHSITLSGNEYLYNTTKINSTTLIVDIN